MEATNALEDREAHLGAKRAAKRTMWLAQDDKRLREEVVKELASEEGRQPFFRIAKQMVRDWQDVSSSSCVKDEDGIIVMEVWEDVCGEVTERCEYMGWRGGM